MPPSGHGAAPPRRATAVADTAPSDADLMVQLRHGHDAALRQLLDRYEHALTHFLYRHTAGQEVEDLFQETWLRVIRSAQRYDPTRPFSTWLFQIALNLCRDWHRRHRPSAVITEEPSSTPPLPAPDTQPRIEARVDAQQLLAALPEPQRAVILLRYYHDHSEAETAAILDCPPGTVKSRLHHALQRLARMVRREEASCDAP